jgi:hypothetical protein
MEHLLSPDDYPLKTPSKLFLYETFCRSLDVINDKKILLMLMRTTLTKISSSNIDTSFLSEVIYRKIENDYGNSRLKEVLCYLIRVDLYEKENAQDNPSTGTDPLDKIVN